MPLWVMAIGNQRLRWLPERLRVGEATGEDSPMNTLVLMRFADFQSSHNIEVVDHAGHRRRRERVASLWPDRCFQVAPESNLAPVRTLQDLALSEQTA